jgi:5-amino-6-(5-phospho-D-ribitylamino)uracil phosphatase
MSDKIYISDLDGTLLNNRADISEFSFKRLSEMIADGLNFTVASARSAHTIRETIRDLPLRLPVIALNGAYISDYETGKHLLINEIDKNIVEELYQIYTEAGCEPMLSTNKNEKDYLYYHESINDDMEWYLLDRERAKDKRITKVPDLRETFRETVVSITLMDKFEKLFELNTRIAEIFTHRINANFFENPYNPGWYWLTVHGEKATKDRAIVELVEMRGFSLDNLTVFGDQMNDLRMFELAPRAVAVENAVDELKKAATEIIGPNEDDSVVKYLMNEFRKETGV